MNTSSDSARVFPDLDKIPPPLPPPVQREIETAAALQFMHLLLQRLKSLCRVKRAHCAPGNSTRQRMLLTAELVHLKRPGAGLTFVWCRDIYLRYFTQFSCIPSH